MWKLITKMFGKMITFSESEVVQTEELPLTESQEFDVLMKDIEEKTNVFKGQLEIQNYKVSKQQQELGTELESLAKEGDKVSSLLSSKF